MLRVALTTKNGQILSKNFDKKEECDIWILEIDEKYGVKRAIIEDKNTSKREIINL